MGDIIKFTDLKAQKQNREKTKSVSKKKIDTHPKTLSLLKVTLFGWMGQVDREQPYRIISIPTSSKLNKLASEILDSFEFELDHLYGFYDNLINWPQSNEIYGMEEDDFARPPTGFVTIATIGEVFNIPKKTMLFLFDFGDEWKFKVEFLKLEIPEGKGKLSAKVIQSKGEAPAQYPDFEA